MTQRTLKLHGTLTIACLGLAASMAACLGDDSTEAPTHDAGADHAVTADSTTTPDNSSPRPDSAPDTSMTPDAGRDVSVVDSSSTPDGGARDSAPEATTADARDSAPEAARETGPDGNPPPVEASPGDARVDQAAEGAAPEAAMPEAAGPEAAPEAGDTALHMCGVFDAAYDIAQPDAGECIDATPPECSIDRANNWSAAILNNYGSGDIFTDCRIAGMFATLTTPERNDYINYILAWNLAFLGCPDVSVTPPPLAYGLMPVPLASHTFTTADLRLISYYYMLAVQQAHVDAPAAVPPLSQTQLDQIDAQLAALEQAVPNKITANTYTFDNCAPDAGSD